MIRSCDDRDFDLIWTIINDGAQAYRGVIPRDRWKDPYMSQVELRKQIEDGVRFWAYEEGAQVSGVMGIQDVQNVTLIRHAYVRTSNQGQGVGSRLLSYLRELTAKPVLIGTWADARWAIRFYEKHGFQLVSTEQKNLLINRYWQIPERQVETSVVLADRQWFERHGAK